MDTRDIVVIGGSSGATAPLKAILGSLPPDLPAAVFVVLHIPARSLGILATVAQAACRLPASPAADGHVGGQALRRRLGAGPRRRPGRQDAALRPPRRHRGPDRARRPHRRRALGPRARARRPQGADPARDPPRGGRRRGRAGGQRRAAPHRRSLDPDLPGPRRGHVPVPRARPLALPMPSRPRQDRRHPGLRAGERGGRGAARGPARHRGAGRAGDAHGRGRAQRGPPRGGRDVREARGGVPPLRGNDPASRADVHGLRRALKRRGRARPGSRFSGRRFRGVVLWRIPGQTPRGRRRPAPLRTRSKGW